MKRSYSFPILVASLVSAGWHLESRGDTEQLPQEAKVARLEVLPSSISLTTPFSYSQVLVTATLENGDRVDATRMAQAAAGSDTVTISPTGVVRPTKDGTGEITFTLGGHSVAVPVTVSGLEADLTVSFVKDVMPTLSKMGCNAGTCHGSQNGKNGFKLSLRGYDPLFDHRALVDDLEGRRFNRSAPEQSLMLLKTTGGVPHVGGALTTPGEPYYELLKRWISAGVSLDLDTPRVTKIDIVPQGPVIPLPEMKQQMQVIATFADGSTRDVTLESFIDSSNTDVAEVDKHGLVTATRRGEAAMLARYEGAYAASTMVVMGNREGYEWKPQPVHNYIDELVDAKLQRVKVLPSGLCSDEEFLRRVHLDLTGQPPTPDEIRNFLADPRPSREKREAVIDQLVGSADFVEYWTNKWADLLQVNRKFLDEKGAWTLRNWIRQAISRNMPYDQFVRSILTASGSTLTNPPAAYYKVLRGAGDVMENTTQLFLAVRFNCNKCHDHPFERWTQDQYYQLSAFFAQVGRKESPESMNRKVGGTNVEQPLPQVEIVYDQDNGDVTHERTGAVTLPQFPYAHEDPPTGNASRREQLAHWLTSKENQYFAKSYMNRVWSYLLGVGLIEPIDDIRAGNPPSNPELLDRLTADFVEGGFDVQRMIRTICRSRVYQSSIETNSWNEDDGINYSHALARRLPAETLYDTVHRATGSVPRLPGIPVGYRAVQLPDPAEKIGGDFLGLLGRPVRESACECERSSGMMLGPILNLVNGPIIAEAIKDPHNHISKLVASQADDAKVVEELFLSILCRMPNEKEKQAGIETLQAYQTEHEELVAAVAAFERDQLPPRQAAWEAAVQSPVNWVPLEANVLTSAAGATLTKQPDGSVLVTGTNGGPEKYTVVASSDLPGITAIQIEALPDASLPAQGPGRAPNGNFVLSELSLTVADASDPNSSKLVPFVRGAADFSQEGWPVQAAFDGNLAVGWAIMPRFGKPNRATFALAEPIPSAGSVLTIAMDQQFPDNMHNLGKFRILVTNDANPIRDSLPEDVSAALAVASEQRTDEQKQVIANFHRTIDPELARLQKGVTEHSMAGDPRLTAAQDLAWALINSPAFLFNH